MDVIELLKQENAELRAMLKTALITIDTICYCGSGNCNYCAYERCIDKCDNSDGFKWVHNDRIKKLIGGEK